MEIVEKHVNFEHTIKGDEFLPQLRKPPEEEK
jgi:hypothetical protein